jgi:hypothetical protein
MTEMLTVEVTVADIASGRAMCVWACPVALALRRATGTSCEVWQDVIAFAPPPPAVACGYYATCMVPLPRKVRRWVQTFDRLAAVKPFRFRVERVPWVKEQP